MLCDALESRLLQRFQKRGLKHTLSSPKQGEAVRKVIPKKERKDDKETLILIYPNLFVLVCALSRVESPGELKHITTRRKGKKHRRS